MEKGLCFGCKKPGHFVINCPNKKKHPAKEKQHGYKGKGKPKVCTTFINICALVNELSEGEMEEFQTLTNNEGFRQEEEEERDQDF